MSSSISGMRPGRGAAARSPVRFKIALLSSLIASVAAAMALTVCGASVGASGPMSLSLRSEGCGQRIEDRIF
jgi:hypothetical protein